MKPVAAEVKKGESQNQSTTQHNYSDVLREEVGSDDIDDDNDDDDGYVHSPINVHTEGALNGKNDDEVKEGRDLCGIVMDVVILGAPICSTVRVGISQVLNKNTFTFRTDSHLT